MTSNYIVYMFPTRKGYFSIILSSVHHESSRLTKMHKLSRKDTDLHVLLYVFPCNRWSLPEMTLCLTVPKMFANGLTSYVLSILLCLTSPLLC